MQYIMMPNIEQKRYHPYTYSSNRYSSNRSSLNLEVFIILGIMIKKKDIFLCSPATPHISSLQ